MYTYQLNNTKHQDTEKGPALEGACFPVCTAMKLALDQSEVQLYQKDGFYYPIKDVIKEAVEMKSAANGTFNVKGLTQVLTYLKEITS